MNRVFVLEGNISERKRVLKNIKDSFTDSYDIIIFDKKDHYDYVSQLLTEMSCFSDNRLFIMKEFPHIESPTETTVRSKLFNRFKKLFPSIPAGNVLVMDNIGISAESFLKEVQKYGEVHKFKQKISKSEGRNVINSYFKKRDIVINEDVSQLLVDYLNVSGDEIDVDKLYLIILKFHHYIHGKNNITKDDAFAVCSSSKEFIIWSLYNMLDQISSSQDKYFGHVVIFVNDFLDNVEHFEYEVTKTINNMIWRYGLLLIAKNGANKKMSQQGISQEISNICKLERKGKAQRIKMNPKIVKDVVVPEYSSKMINSIMSDYRGRPALTCYNYGQLLLIYYTLVKTSLKIRSGCTESEIRIAFSMIISVICGVITKKNTIDGILEHNKVLYGINNGRNI